MQASVSVGLSGRSERGSGSGSINVFLNGFAHFPAMRLRVRARYNQGRVEVGAKV